MNYYLLQSIVLRKKGKKLEINKLFLKKGIEIMEKLAMLIQILQNHRYYYMELLMNGIMAMYV